MTRIIITHVGTSALDKTKVLAKVEIKPSTKPGSARISLHELERRIETENIKNDQALVNDKAFLERCANGLLNHLTQPKWPPNSFKEVPAELHSLHRLGAGQSAKDRVILVCSHTNTGCFCGKLLYYVLRAKSKLFPKGLDVPEIEILNGVETVNNRAFVDEGLPKYANIIAQAYKTMQEDKYESIIFNVTGGYKGIIPFATMTAHLLNAFARQRLSRDDVAKVAYVHEESINPIELLPNLPLEWDGDYGLEERYGALSERTDRTATEEMSYALVHALRNS